MSTSKTDVAGMALLGTGFVAAAATEGIGIPLSIIFTVLKLAEVGQVGDWSWWGVTAPLWGGVAVAAVFVVLAILTAIVSVFRD